MRAVCFVSLALACGTAPLDVADATAEASFDAHVDAAVGFGDGGPPDVTDMDVAAVVPICLFDAGSFACPFSDASCVAPSQYCSDSFGGPDPGSHYAHCAEQLAGCCACSSTTTGADCWCTEDAGRVYVECLVP